MRDGTWLALGVPVALGLGALATRASGSRGVLVASSPTEEQATTYHHAVNALRDTGRVFMCVPTENASIALVHAWEALPQAQKEALDREVRFVWRESAGIRGERDAEHRVVWLPPAHRPPGIPRITGRTRRKLGGRLLSLHRGHERSEPWRVWVEDVMLDSRMERSPLNCLGYGDEKVIVLKPNAKPEPWPEALRGG